MNTTIILLLIPIILIQLILTIINLINISKKTTTKYLNKIIWIIIIIGVNYIGNILYIVLENNYNEISN